MRIIPPITALPHPYGSYVLLERLGVGGMAEVYRAERAGEPNPVVIKRLRPKHAHDEDIARLFVGEAKLARRIRHPNIVEVYEYGEHPQGEIFIAMEYVAGADLRHVLEHAVRAERSLPVWAGIRIVRQLLDALSFAHASTDEHGRARNLVHCDVTPENVLVARSGAVKLGDFGVANDDTRPAGPLADQTKGKLPYMSPEQVLEHRIDARSDLFSAAIVLWEALAGRRLFPGQTPSEIMAQICASPRPPPSRFAPMVSKTLDQIVLTALDPDVDQRYPTAAAFASALDAELRRIEAPRSVEALQREVIGILDAPIVRPDASLTSNEADDGHDELEALDAVHDEPMAGLGYAAPAKMPLEADASTPRPAHLRAADPRATVKTNPRMAAVSVGPSDGASEGASYAFFRGAESENGRRRDRPDIASGTTEALLLDYLEDRDISDRPKSGWSQGPSTPPPVLSSSALAWLRDGGSPKGPLGASTIFDLLGTLARRDRAGRVELSVDRNHWISGRDLAVLLGEPLLDPDVPDGHKVGDLSRQSFVHVVGRLGRARASGRLRAWTHNQDERTRLELHLVDGAVTHVSWTGAAFETWRAAFEDPGLEGQGLPEALSAAITTGTALLPRLEAEASEKVGRQRHLLARRRFETAVGWRIGGFVFSTQIPVHKAPHRQGVLQLLPGVVYTALGAAELESRVLHRNERHLFAVPLQEIGPDLGLTRGEVEALQLFGSADSLASAVSALGAKIDPKFVWAMAYLLTELELLTPIASAQSAIR